MAPDVEMQNAEEDGWVVLTSNDGFAFMLRREVAVGSGTLKRMLNEEGGFSEAKTNHCVIDERGIVVEKLCEYLTFKWAYEGSKEDIPDFTKERIPAELTLELLMAADYFEM